MKAWALTVQRYELISKAKLIWGSGHSRRGFEPNWLWWFWSKWMPKKLLKGPKTKAKSQQYYHLSVHSWYYQPFSEWHRKYWTYPNFQCMLELLLLCSVACSGQQTSVDCIYVTKEICASVCLLGVFKTAQRDWIIRGRNAIRLIGTAVSLG